MQTRKFFSAGAIALTLLVSGCSTPSTEAPLNDISASATEVTTSPSSPVNTTKPAPEPSTEAAPQIEAGSALAVLETLPVKEPIVGGYDRDSFGPSWEDVDNNGCDTRNDILQRDLENITLDGSCKVQTGTYADPYTATTINFDRSSGNGGGIDIDHIVALSAGYKTGGAEWSAAKRLQFANDPLNLISSEAGANRFKKDKDASQWLPSSSGNPAFDCQYVARQISVKQKYEAWVTAPEKDAMKAVLATCPEEPLPTDDTVVNVDAGPAQEAPAPAPEPAVEAPAPDSGVGGADPNYGSCKKAKAAGAGPYVKGVDVEYDFYRDGDGDGTVCE